MAGRKATDLKRQPGCLVKGSPAFLLGVLFRQAAYAPCLQHLSYVLIDNHVINPDGYLKV